MGSTVTFTYDGTISVEEDSMSVYIGDQDIIELFFALQGYDVSIRMEVEGL